MPAPTVARRMMLVMRLGRLVSTSPALSTGGFRAGPRPSLGIEVLMYLVEYLGSGNFLDDLDDPKSSKNDDKAHDSISDYALAFLARLGIAGLGNHADAAADDEKEHDNAGDDEDIRKNVRDKAADAFFFSENGANALITFELEGFAKLKG